jgi:hypothetical protein
MSENKETKNGWGVLIVSVLTVFILWSLNWILLLKFGGNDTEKGQFGDMFGSVNALFSGLAFAFLIYTIWLQREELKLQREELKLQREALELQVVELKRQANELEKTSDLQAKTLNLQKHQLEITKGQIEEERIRALEQNEPKFVKLRIGIDNQHYSWKQVRLFLKNIGASAFDLNIESSDSNFQTRPPIALVHKDQELQLLWQYMHPSDFPNSIDAKLTFRNINNEHKVKCFDLIKTASTGKYELRIK